MKETMKIILEIYKSVFEGKAFKSMLEIWRKFRLENRKQLKIVFFLVYFWNDELAGVWVFLRVAELDFRELIRYFLLFFEYFPV
jgi:hypothetical protein